jgi:hypothetical protein
MITRGYGVGGVVGPGGTVFIDGIVAVLEADSEAVVEPDLVAVLEPEVVAEIADPVFLPSTAWATWETANVLWEEAAGPWEGF